jgi:protein-arginine kinase activator protein McsA
MPYSKICGACSKSKNLEAFNRVTADPRFRKNICQSCEELDPRKFKRSIMTMDIERANV